MNKSMNVNHEKISMTPNSIDDINYYEWNARSHFQIIFVGGGFVTIQTYFDFLDHIANEINIRIVAIPLLYQDHSSFKLLDFSFERQKKIIERILNKVSTASTKNIFMGVDIGASIGMYLNHDFVSHFLINPFYDWNPSIQNKLLHKVSNIPFLYDFIKEYLLKFISFNMFFRIPQKFVTYLNYQHVVDESIPNQSCKTCKPVFSTDNTSKKAAEFANISTSTSLVEGNHFNIIEFIALNTFFEVSNFTNIEEKLKLNPKNVHIFLNESTITNIKSFYEIARRSGVQNMYSVNELQLQLFDYLYRKTKSKEKWKRSGHTSRDRKDFKNFPSHSSNHGAPFIKPNMHTRSFFETQQQSQQQSHSQQQSQQQQQQQQQQQVNVQNMSALPPFMTAQPPPDPLQPLLDLFQNNPSAVHPQNMMNANMGYINNNFPKFNPMQNYLSGLSSNVNYTSSFGASKMMPPQNPMMYSGIPKVNPQHVNASNIQYNTGTLN